MSKRTKVRILGLALSLLAIGAVAGLTLAVTTALGITFKSATVAEVTKGSSPGGPFLFTGRDHLAVCVDVAKLDSSIASTAKDRVESAMQEVTKDPAWKPSGLGTAPVTIDLGCPRPPWVLEPKVKVINLGKKGIYTEPMPIVDQPSQYRTYVYVIPTEEFAANFGDGSPEATQEFITYGDQGTGVAVALYLTQDRLDDAEYMTEWMTKAVGLRAATQ